MNPLSLRLVLFLFLTFLMISTSGCSDDDPVSPPATASGVVKIVVDETAIPGSGTTGYVFTSSLDGTVLGHATWTGPAELELVIPETPGSGFLVTLIQEFHGFQLNLATRHHLVELENSLDLRREKFGDTLRPAILQFENIPPHDHHNIETGSYSGNGGRLFERVQVGLYHEPADILLTMGGPTTPRSFQWIPDVGFETEHQVDLAGLRPLGKASISLPPVSGQLSSHLSGFKKISPGHPWLFYSLDHETFGDSAEPSAWEADFLGTGFDGYLYTCQETVDESPRKMCVVTTEGGLPGSTSMWQLDITVANESRDGCLVQTTGNPENLVLDWNSGLGGNLSWQIEVPAQVQPVVVPHLPEELEGPFPGLDREGLFLLRVTAKRETDGLAGDGVTPMVTRDQVVQYH